MTNENPSTIIGVQETHFNENDAKGRIFLVLKEKIKLL